MAQVASAQWVHTNYAAVNANDIAGNYDSYNWGWIGRDSQSSTLAITFDGVTNDLSTLTLGWKMSRYTSSTGQLDYVVISNSQITAVGNVITFGVSNVLIPPNNRYQSELFAYSGASTNISRTLAQGIVDVRQSLYENDAAFTFPDQSGGVIDWSIFTYSNSEYAPMIVGTNLLASTNANGQVTVSDNPCTDITALASTQALHTAELANLASTQQTVKATADTAFGWGDHATNGYLTTPPETNTTTTHMINLEEAGDTSAPENTISLTSGWLGYGSSPYVYWATQRLLSDSGTTNLNWTLSRLYEDGVNGVWESAGDAVAGNDIVNYSYLMGLGYISEPPATNTTTVAFTQQVTFKTNIFSDVDYIATAPSAKEIPTAEWVRSLTLTGAEWFFTDTVNTSDWAKTANFVDLALDVPASLFTNSIASPVASDTYLAGGITTQFFSSLRSPINFEIYMNRVGGNASTVIPVHPEVYYVYNGTTNQLGDWEAADQTIDATTPTKYTFTVAFGEPALTGTVCVVGYLKSATVSGTAAGLNIYGGGIYPSHMDIGGIASGEGIADWADYVAVSDVDVADNDITNVNSVAFSTGGVDFAVLRIGKLDGTNAMYVIRNGTNYAWSMGTTD